MNISKDENNTWTVKLDDSNLPESIYQFGFCKTVFEVKSQFLQLMSIKFDEATNIKFLYE